MGNLPRANPAWETDFVRNGDYLAIYLWESCQYWRYTIDRIACGHKSPWWQGVSVWVPVLWDFVRIFCVPHAYLTYIAGGGLNPFIIFNNLELAPLKKLSLNLSTYFTGKYVLENDGKWNVDWTTSFRFFDNLTSN